MPEELPVPVAADHSSRHGLAYERIEHLAGLQQDARIIKTPSAAFGILADGRRLGLSQLREEDRLARLSRQGALTDGFALQLEQLSEAEAAAEQPAAAYFRVEVDWADLAPRLFALGANGHPDESLREAAQAELAAAIEEQGAALAAQWQGNGVKVRSVGRMLPVVFLDATVARLRELARDPHLVRLTSAAPLQPQLRAGCNGGPDKPAQWACDVDPNVFHRIDTAFNAINNNYADNQRIAVYEDVGDCVLYESHEALQAFSSIIYSNPTPNTSGNVGGVNCPAEHGTWVASVLNGSSDGVPCGSAKAELYYPNRGLTHTFVSGNVITSICNAQATLDAYNWMSNIGRPPDEGPPLAVVNESFGCVNTGITCDYAVGEDWEGITQDYFSRYFDMAIVKAAGNQGCDPTDNACPFSLNSLCVGSSDSQHQMSCFSSHTNPGNGSQNGLSTKQPDREEPDLVAYGGQRPTCSREVEEQVCVADGSTTSTTGWEGNFGTSFSAPVVSSMIALLRERCEPIVGSRLDSRWLRALFRNAAVEADPIGAAYSTPKPNVDHFDGAGVISAEMLGCGGPDTPGISGGGPININVTTGGTPPSGDNTHEQNGHSPPGETQQLKSSPGGYQAQAFGYTPPGSGRVGEVLESWSLDVGDRLRVSFAWDGCALTTTGAAPTSVAVDFDLFLYNRDAADYVIASQSLHDNNEGFDYTVPAGQNGNYDLWLVFPQNSASCEAASTSPSAFAWHLWPI